MSQMHQIRFPASVCPSVRILDGGWQLLENTELGACELVPAEYTWAHILVRAPPDVTSGGAYLHASSTSAEKRATIDSKHDRPCTVHTRNIPRRLWSTISVFWHYSVVENHARRLWILGVRFFLRYPQFHRIHVCWRQWHRFTPYRACILISH